MAGTDTEPRVSEEHSAAGIDTSEPHMSELGMESQPEAWCLNIAKW